ncbi:type II CRISPR RNA-guided endonuclease Cas9 [Xylocopilactobacillus apicola]|uniref:CRISPR-associated endonuclease Cas9 n=1 Tax=Xylocopilactobacillus apicola TaxID=2932184 RepID=A0AAU9DBQ2_9LACO|nr:type II CRISPR RNA-guided endonuclease Cas9 [Xylocopilactobacillus apicola]BDR58247.1 CRISPR-associated endonuclease Cas9 [Xylocopilactobacillus apicola]
MKYNVGLDIGTGSVGWAVIDDEYQVLEARNKKLMGVRLFSSADTAEERRTYRTTRRRLSRRRWRIRLLNEIFAPELAAIDEIFLKRLKYTWVHPLDEKNRQFYYGGALFGDSKSDRDFYQKYPTIYHLRQALTNDGQKHDLREVYLAIHHLTKYRGHFLIEGQINPEKTFDLDELVNSFKRFNPDGAIFEVVDSSKIEQGLLNFGKSKTGRVEEALTGISVTKTNLALTKAILMGIVGNTVDLIKIFDKAQDIEKEEQKNYKIKFSDENLDETLEKLSSLLSEDENQFVNELRGAYDGLTLRSILQKDKSISDAMVRRYEQHKKDLQLLKNNFRNAKTKKAFDESYKNVLSHDEKKRDEGKKYFRDLIVDKIALNFANEVGFNEIRKVIINNKSRDEDIQKSIAALTEIVKKRVDNLDPLAISDYKLIQLLSNINLGTFLETQRNKSNGVIPHQLHENELTKIIEKQGKYYPFLAKTFEKEGKTENKLIALLNFRVPYYVGPLVEKEDVQGDGTNHWMQRKEKGAITPWNFSEKVDSDESAERFIKRMTLKDTYLIHEDTIPQNTLLYQKYTVLQELNNVRYKLRDDPHRHRLPVKLKQKIFENCFKEHVNVTKKMVEDFIFSNEGMKCEISGLSSKTKFNNSLKTYNYFVGVFGRDFVEDSDNQKLLEQIVEIQTIFEDRKLIKRRLTKLEKLSSKQIARLSNKHYTGWGRLSEKFLTSKHIYTKLVGDNVPANYSIIDLLYKTSLNLMEIMNEPKYKINDWIKRENETETGTKNIYQAIDDLAGAPNIKRGIRQSFRILDDIKKAMGGVAPSNVFLEFARETQSSKTTNARIDRIKKLYANSEIKKDFADVSRELTKANKESIKDDRLYLYYLQLGRDMYTGDRIPIGEVSTNYDIDHIIPQAYVKDNSLDNRVLVNRADNARKSDSPVYVPEIIERMSHFWRHLLNLGLISQEKFNYLTRKDDFSDAQKKRFIARSLVETRQIIKNVAMLIEQYYGDNTKAVAIRASLTNDMRKYFHKFKSRDINDYHHAHDALLIATVGKYIQRRGFDANGDFTYNEYNSYTKEWLRKKREEGKGRDRIEPYSFVVGSMRSRNQELQTNRETGEIVWTDENYRYLIKQLENQDLIFSRRTEDSKGKLYKETRFSSKLHDEKTKAKQSFNDKQSVDLYGGFDSIQLAYSILIYYKKEFRLMGLRRLWVDEMKKDPEFLQKKIDEIIPGARVVLDHIPSEQEIIRSGAKMTIGSATELHNAQQLYLEHDLYNNLSVVLKSDTEDRADARLKSKTARDILNEAYDAISIEMREYFPMHENYLVHMLDYRENFENLDYEKQVNMIKDILGGLHADPTCKKIDFSSSFGRFQNKTSLSNGYTLGYKMGEDDAFVFNSPSGLFRRIVKVKDLPEAKKILEN